MNQTYHNNIHIPTQQDKINYNPNQPKQPGSLQNGPQFTCFVILAICLIRLSASKWLPQLHTTKRLTRSQVNQNTPIPPPLAYQQPAATSTMAVFPTTQQKKKVNKTTTTQSKP
ncbi:hypothetical protein PGTUg99_035602 [Puccinia graminis f. sp. tritici]|uniref:Uncharacterized protein n=1 Tax=Puccinia graminis f. sp. tritici TaxID=56615 RepID=A0A5B0R9E2_PUCGR|nr:hypothetical protein PGTUg99_035602 [Puccinia graminis f. sp. tritici]